jgi:SpoIID/LytB domain protein
MIARHTLRAFAMSFVLFATLVVTSVVPVAPSPASADSLPPAGITVRGHGNGHGRGMSQFGAYGWAIGWTGQPGISWDAILDFYYGGGGRTLSTFTDADSRFLPEGLMTTRLTVHDGRQTAVVSENSSLTWAGRPEQYASIIARPVGRNRYDIYASSSVSCGSTTGTPAGFNLINPNVAGPIDLSTANSTSLTAINHSELVGVCEPGSRTRIRYYRGIIRAVNDANGAYRTVNRVATESYLRGVVPRESPASWADSAGGAGINALRAQAVAARSYALSESRYSFAKTCDSQDCQVYGGAALRTVGSSSVQILEDPRSDLAITDTANYVMRHPSGTIVRTEYTSSNGGRTAGGTFPAKDDPGDIAADAVWQSWTRVFSAEDIQKKYPSIGVFLSAVSNHDGLGGDWGGYTTSVVINGTAGSITRSGWQFRSEFSLPNPWYHVSAIVGPNPNAAPVGSILFVGDSVGESISKEFRTTVMSTYPDVNFQACAGRGMAGASCLFPITSPQLNLDGVGVVNTSATPAIAVVQLGYNDDPATFASEADQMIAALTAKAVQRIIFVNLSTRSTSRNYTQSNQVLANLAANNPNISVFDWNAHSSPQDKWRWFDNASLCCGVHLNPSGRAEFALFLREQLDVLRNQNVLPVTASSSSVVLGLPIRRNDQGTMIKTVQKRLNSQMKLSGRSRIPADGKYGTSTIRVVKRFQKSAGLRASGVVDRATWDALGLANRSDLGVLRVGARSASVKSLQTALGRVLKKKITPTGVFTTSLANDVKTYQRRARMRASGRVGPQTWTSLMVTVARLSVDTASVTTPAVQNIDNTILFRKGSRGTQVRNIQRQLNIALAGQRSIRVDGDYGSITANAVKMFQRSQGLRATGVTTQATWDALFG